MRALDVARVEISREDDHRPLTPIFAQAARDTPERLLRRVTTPAPDGRARFHADPPMLRPIDDDAAAAVIAALDAYRATLGAGRLQIVQWYRPDDVARRGQGVDSLGLAGWVVLCYGNGPSDPRFLHVKEIGPCAWTPWLAPDAPERTAHHGQRAAEAQARTQTVSESVPRLGHRERRAMRRAPVVGSQGPMRTRDARRQEPRRVRRELCGQVLAKAHARTGDAAMLAGYCGGGDNLDRALTDFAIAYAEQAERDYEASRDRSASPPCRPRPGCARGAARAAPLLAAALQQRAHRRRPLTVGREVVDARLVERGQLVEPLREQRVHVLGLGVVGDRDRVIRRDRIVDRLHLVALALPAEWTASSSRTSEYFSHCALVMIRDVIPSRPSVRCFLYSFASFSN